MLRGQAATVGCTVCVWLTTARGRIDVNKVATSAGAASATNVLPMRQSLPTSMPMASGPTKEPNRPKPMAQPTPVERIAVG